MLKIFKWYELIEKISNTVSAVFTDDGFLYGNSMLIEDSIRTVIDSGCGKILDTIRPESVDILLNSHCHLDHINGNEAFTNSKILMHRLDAESLKYPDKITATENWDELMHENTGGMAARLSEVNTKLLQKWRIDDYIHDGQYIDCGKTKIEVLHTPGHTSGHCSFYFQSIGAVFTGDICLTRVGPWYGDPDTNLFDFIASINRIIELKPDILITGHVISTIRNNIKDRLEEYRNRIFIRGDKIYEYIKTKPSTIDEISEQKFIYGAHANTFVLYWERAMVKKHLDQMLSEDRVQITDNGIYAATA